MEAPLLLWHCSQQTRHGDNQVSTDKAEDKKSLSTHVLESLCHSEGLV